jgi:hypothetical protein
LEWLFRMTKIWDWWTSPTIPPKKTRWIWAIKKCVELDYNKNQRGKNPVALGCKDTRQVLSTSERFSGSQWLSGLATSWDTHVHPTWHFSDSGNLHPRFFMMSTALLRHPKRFEGNISSEEIPRMICFMAQVELGLPDSWLKSSPRILSNGPSKAWRRWTQIGCGVIALSIFHTHVPDWLKKNLSPMSLKLCGEILG